MVVLLQRQEHRRWTGWRWGAESSCECVEQTAGCLSGRMVGNRGSELPGGLPHGAGIHLYPMTQNSSEF